VPGLAQDVLDRLVSQGFRKGITQNNSNQQLSGSTVYYAPGQKNAARVVGKLLKVSSVRALDAGTQSIAGADAGVVVVAGQDLST